MANKSALIFFILFIVFSLIVLFIPEVSLFDIQIIKGVQSALKDFNSDIPILAGGIIFYILTFLPLLVMSIYFTLKKTYRLIFLYCALPFITYILNGGLKLIINRPRPPLELQLEEHMSSSSYVSRHTFVSACLYGVFIYFLLKYCKNKYLKYFLIMLSILWILFEGFSRVWQGVHYPSDVIGAYLLSIVFIIIYIKVIQYND